jgi:PAS domain S-box-containing protein
MNRNGTHDAARSIVGSSKVVDLTTVRASQQCLLDAVPAAAYLCAVDGRILAFNDQAVELWGRRPQLNNDADRFCGSFRLFTVDGQPIAHNECWMALALRDQQSYTGREAVVERPDGSRRFALAHANPLFDDAGTICGAINVLVDVTQMRQSEHELRRTSHLLQAVADGTTDAIFVKDRQGHYLFFNEAAARFVGRAAADVIGQTDAAIFEPASVERIRQQDRRVMDSGRVHTDEEELTAAGVTRTYLVTKAPYWDDRGNVAGVIGISRDITQRKRAEHELRASEERLRALIAAVPDMIFRLDPAGVFVDCKAEPHPDLIMPPQQFLGKHYSEVMPPHVNELIAQAIEAGRSSGLLQTFDYELALPPGQQWYEARLMVAPDGYSLVVARNVTAQRLGQQSLEQSEARLKLALATAQMGVWQWNLVNDQIFWSPECYQIFGDESFDGSLTGFKHLIHPDDFSEVMAAARGAIENHCDYSAEFRIIRGNGELRWLTKLGRAEYGEQGTPVRMVGTIQDVTERHLAQEDLQKTQQFLRAIFDAEPECLKLLDSEGTLLEINTVGLSMLEAEHAADVLGRCAFDLVVPEHREAYRAMHERVLRGGKERLEFDLIGLRGTRRSLETHVVPLWRTSTEQPLHLAITRDVTERKRLEEQFRQSQKMEAVGRLAGGVAHDFNNLLTVISGFSELLLMKLEGESPLRTNVQAIQDASQRAAALTRQMLAFSRKQMLDPSVLNLNEVVRAAEVMLRRLIGEDILMEVELDPELQQVIVDRGQIEQVIMNLVVNARDTMPYGGRLTIATRNLPVDSAASPAGDRAAGFVELAVSDTGCGMSEQVKAKIFDPFFTTKELGKGTGLGLAVVHGIVSQSGGQIEVETRLGEGTTFRVSLPSTVQQAAAKPADAARVVALGGHESILLVEDDAAVRDFTLLALRDLGYRVLAAKSGPEAIDLVEREQTPIQLLVSDVVMPEMSGPMLAEVLRGRFPELRVLFVSGYADDAIGQRGLIQSAAAFLHKPFAPQALASKVREVLDDADCAR